MSILGFLAGLVISIFGVQAPPHAELGASIPNTPALIDTYLASGITSTDTSMTLANGTTRGGSALSGFTCFVIDVNQPTVEYVCGTASSTSVTGLSRGVDVLNPNSTSTALAYSHRRFASVQITDYPTIQFMARKLNGTDDFDATLKYATTVTTSTIGSDPKNLVNVDYVSDISVTGCANASALTRGCVELATQSEVALGTETGGTGASLVVPNSFFSPTSTATTTVPVTNTSGKLSQGFLDLTSSFTFSGGLTSSGATTLSATTTLSGASTTISGDVLSTGNFTFSKIPTGSATLATSTNQIITKNYVDTYAFNSGSGLASNSLGVNSTSTAISITTTAATSSVFHTCYVISLNDGGASHSMTLNKGNTTGQSVSMPTGDVAGRSVFGIWDSLTPATYNFTMKHTASSGSTSGNFYCSAFVLPQSN